jgi:hypothetical protein
MTWDMPIRPLQNGPLSNKEIKELDAFLLADDGLEDPMDFFTFDGFICAVLSAPHTILPSEWLRWVWDQKQGAQAPEFASEKQAKRILSLLIGHATCWHSRWFTVRSIGNPCSIRTRSEGMACRSLTNGAAATSKASRSVLRLGSHLLRPDLTGLK